MAAAQHNLTRRALLGAAFVPLAGTGALSSSFPRKRESSSASAAVWIPDQVRDDGRWEKALARFQTADAALAAVAHSDDEALYDRLGARHDAALRRLLRTAAPNLAAFAVKLGLALDDRAVEFVGDAAAMKSLKPDVRRRAGGTAP
jgi:hypothetical protein